MKKILKYLKALKFYMAVNVLLFSVSYSYPQLIVNPPIQNLSEANDLVRNTLTGKHSAVSNFKATFYYDTTYGAGSMSSFSTGSDSAKIGLSGGIIISTGDVRDAIGPNNSPDKFTGYTLTKVTPDADLEALAGCTYCTYDLNTIEYDFIPTSTTLSFSYVFASEEYPEYVCSQYNDVFGIFVTGPKPGGGTYPGNNNIAKIPSTNLPVAINTVNSGFPGVNPDPPHNSWPATNCKSLDYKAYYVDNDTGATSVHNLRVQFDGYTKVFNAQINVMQGAQYHIKLALADVADYKYDSGLLLEEVDSTLFVNNLMKSQMDINIFPIPADKQLSISFQQPANEPIRLYMYDATGRLMFYSPAFQKQIYTSNLPDGVYMLKIVGDSFVGMRKVIVKH